MTGSMRRRITPAAFVPVFLALLASLAALSGCATPGGRKVTARALDSIVIGPRRPARDLGLDRYRHPVETLLFFGIRPRTRVLLVWPKSGYYTRIIAPLVRRRGMLYAGVIPPPPGNGFLAARLAHYRRLLASEPALFDRVQVVDFPLDGALSIPPGSVNMVLAFRDLHEWMALGAARRALRSIYRALSPGGVLGIVDNRGDPSRPQDPRARNGYVRQDYAIRLIESAGFRLVATSEVNANPRDTRDYPAGVWALPPTYRLGTIDRAKYAAIGESDRFTLKFVKRARGD
jgi:predicted methyltransferase